MIKIRSAISIAGVTPVFAEDSTALSLDTWDALSSLYSDPLDGLEVLETSGLFDANWTSDPNGSAKKLREFATRTQDHGIRRHFLIPTGCF